MEEKVEKLTCDFCHMPVDNGSFWVILRGYHQDAQEDGSINLEDWTYKDVNIKSEKIICQDCVRGGKAAELEFN